MSEREYALSDCLFWSVNSQGDCGGRVKKHHYKVSNGLKLSCEADVVMCETCFNQCLNDPNKQPHVWEVQVGKDKSAYKPRYRFVTPTTDDTEGWLYYSSLNIHSGYKKRLVLDGKVIARYIS